ncbi:MAG: 4-hydroxy-tetrahydrodipicolinate synthase [Alphaproteobacteria bacterium]|nr:4-hydroxy-tetrahydrodipicolinate synthase [Alphaproteobacteria bacterium]
MDTLAEKDLKRSNFIDDLQDIDVITAMPTPMLPPRNGKINGAVDYDAVYPLIHYYLHHKVDGILVGGSTGQEPTMDRHEKRKLVTTVLKALKKEGGSTKLFVGTGSASTQETLEETKWAASIGADAAVVILPPQVKPNRDGQIYHYGLIASQVPNLPIIIYNIPSRTGVNMQPDTVAELAHRWPNIIGIKQSYPDLAQVEEMKKLCPENFLIYSGDDNLTLEMLKRGAHGVISVASNMDNEAIVQMVTAYKKGRLTEAEHRNKILDDLFNACFVTTNPISIQTLLSENVAPWMTSTVRPPLTSMNPHDHQEMLKLYRTYLSKKHAFVAGLNNQRD